MLVPNSYILKSSAVTNSVIENICQQFVARSKKSSQVTGKKELSQLRTLLLHDVAVHGELDGVTLQALLALLQSLTENDNNNNDRKIFRCVLYLLMENLCMRYTLHKPDKLPALSQCKGKLLDLLQHEVGHRQGLHRVLVLRLLGMAAGPGACSSLSVSPGDRAKAMELLVQTLSSIQLPSYTKASSDSDNKVLQLVGCCSGLRRLNQPVPDALLQTLLSILKVNNKTLIRHVAALLLIYTKQCSDLEVIASVLKDILMRQVTSSSILKDDLALSYLLRASRLLWDKATAGKVQEMAREMVDHVMQLIPSASLKTLNDIMSLYFGCSADWDLVPMLEDRHNNIIKQLISAVTAIASSIAPENVRFPLFCRLCESLGRFLWMRPAYGNGRMHKIFSVFAVERDGAQLIGLWRVLSRYHLHMTSPRAAHVALPNIVKNINSSAAVPDQDLEKKSYWAFEHEQHAKNTKSISSPYLFTCLLKAMIWIAPDQRYCVKDHAVLWARFLGLLVSAFEILSCNCAESAVGDVYILLPDLLHAVFTRMQASLMVAQSHPDKTLHVLIHYSSAYLDTLYTLCTLSLRTTSSPLVSDLLPSVWSMGLALGMSSAVPTNRLHACSALVAHLMDVINMIEGAHKFKTSLKKELLLGLQESAVWQLSEAMPLLLSVLEGDRLPAVSELCEFLIDDQLMDHVVVCDHTAQRLISIAGSIAGRMQAQKEAPKDSLLDDISAGDDLLQSLLLILEALYGILTNSSSTNRSADMTVAINSMLDNLTNASLPGVHAQIISGMKTLVQNAKSALNHTPSVGIRHNLSLGLYCAANCTITDAPPPSSEALAFNDADFSMFDAKPEPVKPAPAPKSTLVSAFDIKPEDRPQIVFDALPSFDFTTASAGSLSSTNDWDLLVPTAMQPAAAGAVFDQMDDFLTITSPSNSIARDPMGFDDFSSATVSKKTDFNHSNNTSMSDMNDDFGFGKPIGTPGSARSTGTAASVVLAPPPAKKKADSKPAVDVFGFDSLQPSSSPAVMPSTPIASVSAMDFDIFTKKTTTTPPAPAPVSASSAASVRAPSPAAVDFDMFTAPKPIASPVPAPAPSPVLPAAVPAGTAVSSVDFDILTSGSSKPPHITPPVSVKISNAGIAAKSNFDMFDAMPAPLPIAATGTAATAALDDDMFSGHAFTAPAPAAKPNNNSVININISSAPVAKPAASIKAIPLAPPAPSGMTAKNKRASMSAASHAFNNDLTGLVSAPTTPAGKTAPVDPFAFPAAAPIAAAPASKPVPVDPFGFTASAASFDFPAPSASKANGFDFTPSTSAGTNAFPGASSAASGFDFAPSAAAQSAWPGSTPAASSAWPGASTARASTPTSFLPSAPGTSPFPDSGFAPSPAFSATPAFGAQPYGAPAPYPSTYPAPAAQGMGAYPGTPVGGQQGFFAASMPGPPLPGAQGVPSAGAKPVPKNPFEDM